MGRTPEDTFDIILIGAGIMSATLGTLLKELEPGLKVAIFERLDRVGAESSDAWNNAGTGHAAYCELNYTPLNEKGDVEIEKALKIGSSFEVSKQFWSFLKSNELVNTPFAFINDVDHMSFVLGQENVEFLKKRYQALHPYALFEEMVYSEDRQQIQEWIPLMMEGRDKKETLAVTRMAIGTDVNFGAVTRSMIQYLDEVCDVQIFLGQEVREITRSNGKKDWEVTVRELKEKATRKFSASFVFIGAGGGAMSLLEQSGIPEGRGFGGFPVSGQWLRCNNPRVIARHDAKVYGKAAVGSPPMSVPHLDTRMMEGKRSLLFGPYAGFSTKFLKHGSYWDLPLSIEVHNVWPLLSAGMRNIDLTKYLIKQVTQSQEDRFATLQRYYPEAKFEDWDLEMAGQRVQIIKKDKNKGGVLKFGTEIVCSKDRTLAALLGASPGASTSVSIMLDVLMKCFAERMQSKAWQQKLKYMIPTFGESLVKNPALCRRIRDKTSEVLRLKD